MDMYLHVRVLFSMILGLGVSWLLTGVARIVQHPKEYKFYWVHLLWSFFLFIYLLHFWWWEYRLQGIQKWTFPLYVFIAFYAVLLFFLCVLMFPQEMQDYDSFKTYFYSRRKWIFSLMTTLFVVDLVDTLIKGHALQQELGTYHLLSYTRAALFIPLSAVAIKVSSERFHVVFAIVATLYELLLIWLVYMTVG
jgi:hypothetical protein